MIEFESIKIDIDTDKVVFIQRINQTDKFIWVSITLAFIILGIISENPLAILITLGLLIYMTYSLLKREVLIIKRTDDTISKTIRIAKLAPFEQYKFKISKAIISCQYEADFESCQYTFYATVPKKVALMTVTKKDTQIKISQIMSSFLNCPLVFDESRKPLWP